MIVIPERETPGISARICETPIANAVQNPSSPMRFSCGRRSATQRMTPKTARKIAIWYGCPSLFSIVSSPTAPASAAGIVAKKIHQAIRSSIVVTARRRTDVTQAPR